jgi:hypothetical protein
LSLLLAVSRREVVRLVEMTNPTFISLEEVVGFICHTSPAEGMQLWDEAKRQLQLWEVQMERFKQQQQQQAGSFHAAAAATGAAAGAISVLRLASGGGPEPMSVSAGDGSGSGSELDQADEPGDAEEPEDAEEADQAAGDTDDDGMAGAEAAMQAASVNPDDGKGGQVVFHPFSLVTGPLLSLGYQVRHKNRSDLSDLHHTDPYS